uniref:Uncharacterized protein n=1 Tax=Timema genevievae TaxID=629358 RepID=A0A7R9PJ95_TIMGE|nr:unnamed protein product [Timema genevievae]
MAGIGLGIPGLGSRAVKTVALGAAVPVLRDDKSELDTLIDEAKAEVNKLKTFIDTTSAAAQAEVTTNVKDAYLVVQQKIEEAQKKGETLGIDVSDCVEGRQATVDTDVDTLTKNAFGCITDQTDQALGDVNTLLTDIETAEKDIDEAQAALDACGDESSTWNKAKCIAKETVKVAEEAIQLKDSVTKSYTNAKSIYDNFPTTTKKCENDQVDAAGTDATQITASIEVCLVTKGITG